MHWLEASEKVVEIFQTSGDVLLGVRSRRGEWSPGMASSLGEALQVSCLVAVWLASQQGDVWLLVWQGLEKQPQLILYDV